MTKQEKFATCNGKTLSIIDVHSGVVYQTKEFGEKILSTCSSSDNPIAVVLLKNGKLFYYNWETSQTYFIISGINSMFFPVHEYSDELIYVNKNGSNYLYKLNGNLIRSIN